MTLAAGARASGPTLEDLVVFRADEARHFEWMVEAAAHGELARAS